MGWGRSLPVHPFGIVSLRQHETRTVPGDETWMLPPTCVPNGGSKIRICVPSFKARNDQLHAGIIPNPFPQTPTSNVVPA